MPEPLYVIGIVPHRQAIAPDIAELIEKADVLAGGRRLLDLFKEHPHRLELSTPLKKWLHKLQEHQAAGRRVTVLTSGDPNYFGLAKTLIRELGSDFVRLIPSPTTVQQAFARLKISWEKTKVVSLHGRGALSGHSEFWPALFRAGQQADCGCLAVYTDEENNPAALAAQLLERGQENWRLTVCQDLGSAEEKIVSCSLREAETMSFSPLNLAVFQRLSPPKPISLAMAESEFIHEAGLITKREIRAVSLGLLNLSPQHCLWDLGAGCGSVSIEAAALLSYGSIWAVEKNPRRVEHIKANRSRFGVCQLEIVEGDSLSAIDKLPEPDRVFIGGGGRSLGQIIESAASRLKPGGLILINAVTFEALQAACSALKGLGLDRSVTQLQAARSEPLAGSFYFKPINQIWLLRASLPQAA